MTFGATFPWQKTALESVRPAAVNLIVGETGDGVEQFALALAAKNAGVDNPDSHPDFLLVGPEKNKIIIEAARKIIEFCALTPSFLARRQVIIFQSHLLNPAAANALLKTLEEPGDGKVLYLCAPTPLQLPPTIVSRCRIIAAPSPTAEQARQWLGDEMTAALAFCGGLPLSAKSVDAQEIAQLADFFGGGKKMDITAAGKQLKNDDWICALQKWVTDGIRVSAGLTARFFPGANFCAPCHLHRWLNFYAALIERRREMEERPAAKAATMADTLYDYKKLFADVD